MCSFKALSADGHWHELSARQSSFGQSPQATTCAQLFVAWLQRAAHVTLVSCGWQGAAPHAKPPPSLPLQNVPPSHVPHSSTFPHPPTTWPHAAPASAHEPTAVHAHVPSTHELPLGQLPHVTVTPHAVTLPQIVPPSGETHETVHAAPSPAASSNDASGPASTAVASSSVPHPCHAVAAAPSDAMATSAIHRLRAIHES
jgi:hypothetical protein